jgi:hypothetical protein
LGLLFGVLACKHRIWMSSKRSVIFYSMLAGYSLLSVTYDWLSASLIDSLNRFNYGFTVTHVGSLFLAGVTYYLVQRLTVLYRRMRAHFTAIPQQ